MKHFYEIDESGTLVSFDRMTKLCMLDLVAVLLSAVPALAAVEFVLPIQGEVVDENGEAPGPLF